MAEQVFGNPWIFEEILSHHKRDVSKEELRSVITKHLQLLIDEKGEYTAVREMRKFIAWYIKGLENATQMRNIVNQIEHQEELIEKIESFLSD